MAHGDTGLTNLVLTGDLTVAGDISVNGTGIITYSETVALADFTDGASTAGTLNLAVDIPAGAYVLCSKIKDVTGFIGDTSATMLIGTSTDTNRYVTGTPSVFTTADYVDAGVPSGAPFHAADQTVLVTVTADSDFGDVTAGQATIEITYIA